MVVKMCQRHKSSTTRCLAAVAGQLTGASMQKKRTVHDIGNEDALSVHAGQNNQHRCPAEMTRNVLKGLLLACAVKCHVHFMHAWFIRSEVLPVVPWQVPLSSRRSPRRKGGGGPLPLSALLPPAGHSGIIPWPRQLGFAINRSRRSPVGARRAPETLSARLPPCCHGQAVRFTQG